MNDKRYYDSLMQLYIDLDLDTNTLINIIKYNHKQGDNLSSEIIDETVDIITSKEKKADKNDITLQTIISAVKTNNKEQLFKLIKDGKVNNLDFVASVAASKGHIDVVMDLVNLGAKNYNFIAWHAARSGYLCVVVHMLSLGANKYHELLESAVSNNHRYIYDYINNNYKINVDYDLLLEIAAYYNNVDYVREFIHKATSLDRIFIYACINGHRDIVELLLTINNNIFFDGFQASLRNGKFNTAVYLDSKYGILNENYDVLHMIENAVANEYIDVLHYLLTRYKLNKELLNELFDKAVAKKLTKSTKYLKSIVTS